MTSLARKIRRKRLGTKTYNEMYPRPTQPVRMHADDRGYDALHPTKGWKRYSARRLAAQFRMAQLLGA